MKTYLKKLNVDFNDEQSLSLKYNIFDFKELLSEIIMMISYSVRLFVSVEGMDSFKVKIYINLKMFFFINIK